MHFANGQPNDYSGGEDCVHFTPRTGTTRPDLHPFNDASCHSDDLAIGVCHAPLLPCYPALQCQAGYMQINYKCYKLHQETQSYDAAQQTCASEGAKLIEPRSQADLHLLQTLWGHFGERWG